MKAMRKPEPDREREGAFDAKQNRRDQKGAGSEPGGTGESTRCFQTDDQLTRKRTLQSIH